jgi:hypothetical protein
VDFYQGADIMVIDHEETVSAQISDGDLLWAGLNDWQVAYLSQATPDQREIVYREAIRLSMSDNDSFPPGLGF